MQGAETALASRESQQAGKMYTTPNPYQSNYAPIQSIQSQSSLIQRVSYLLCTALLVTALSAYIARDWSPTLGLPLMIGTFACVVALSFTRNNPAIGLLLLYALSIMEGLMMGPLLAMIARGFPFGGMIVAEATGLSGVIVAGLGSYVWISNKDFGYLGKTLFIALIAIVVISIVAMFWHTLAAMGQFQMLISLAIVAVFVGFTLYDFSNIKLRYGPNDFVIATVALYLDFINLFWAILQILMMLASGGSGRRR
jgi:modulator of FtsH protease